LNVPWGEVLVQLLLMAYELGMRPYPLANLDKIWLGLGKNQNLASTKTTDLLRLWLSQET